MITDLSGYVLEPLWEGSAFVLWRGRHPAGGVPILVRTPGSAPQTPVTLGRLEHEFSLADELDPAWAVRPLALVQHEGRRTLVLEDPGGDPAGGMLGQPLELTRFLKVAIALTAAVRQVHQGGLIHKDIKPAHVLIDAAGDVRLTGFGIASRLPREHQAPSSPEVIAGTFAYMAPEQTGRMNRSVDARSDLYSLGVTLYEFLTGTLPFTASDPMEWIHCHIARTPTPPSERLSGIPPPVEAIILKLLAKTAEDRYQTAAGIEADLRRCLASWTALGRIDPFAPGANDASDRLLIPEKLYGRDTEIRDLVAAFAEVMAEGTSGLVLVSGYAGIGKSSIVNELHKVLVPPRGLFAAGKFDQHKRDIPYATLAQAFQSLVRRILGRDDAELNDWRYALLEALGPNGQLMVNLIPELAMIIGEQPPIPDLPPQDAQSRFQMVFRRFLGVFARPEHPLALFLDDLQWLDAATLTLIEHLLTHSEVRHLLLVGAYRDNEVSTSHPLVRALTTIREAGGRVQEIVLDALIPEHVEALIADALRSEPARVRPLAELVFERTAGNPFFTIQFIAALAEEALLVFDTDTATWTWDLPGIRAKGFTDNVADLMAAKLGRLPLATQRALGQLACLGNAAETATLALVQGELEAAVHSALWLAVRAGLVHRQDSGYAFVHDRIQEAAHALVPEGERAMAHLQIGRLLTLRTAPEELEEGIFDIVNQFDRAAGLIDTVEERDQVAVLNLIAGKRAKAATAYASALQYFATGCALVGEAGWDRCYGNTFDLELNWSECEYLTGELASAEARLASLSTRARDTIDLAAVTCVRVNLYTILDQSDNAVAVGLDYLRQYDSQWSRHATAEDIREEHHRLSRLLESASIEALLDLAPMSDLALRATMNVLTALLSPAQFTDLDLFRLVIVRMAALSLEHGNTDGSALAYALLGGTVTIYLGDPQAGARLGRLALDLVEKRGFDRLRGRVYSVLALHVAHWTQHLATCRVFLRGSFEAAQNAGDLTFAAFARVDLVTNLLAAGEPLTEVEREAESALAFVRGARFGLISDVIVSQLRLVRTLRGLTPDINSFDDADFRESDFEEHLENNPRLAIATSRYWIRKLQARVYAGNYAAAAAAESKVASLLWTLPTQVELPEYHFYAALARAGYSDSIAADERSSHLEALAVHHKRLALWAESCTENFSHRAALVGAELARLEGRDLDAERFYEEAIRSARKHGFVQNEALSNERAAQFYAARGFETIADAYIRNARDCYLRWGADGKVRQLDESHPRLRQGAVLSPAGGTTGTPVEHLDLATVVRLSQAISEEIDLSKLIDTLMVIALEHAGADRGLLILPQSDELLIEAEAKTARDGVVVEQRRSRASAEELPESVLRYVTRTRDSVLLDDSAHENPFSEDNYFRRVRSRSVLCLPLTKQATLVGVLYLENTQTSHVFTPARTAVLKLVASQASISLENARLYAGLRQTEAYLAEAQRVSRTGSFVITTTGGKLNWSDELYRIYEFDRSAEMTLELARQRTHPDETRTVSEKIQEGTPPDGGAFNFEHRLLMPDGSVKHLQIAVRAYRDASGGIGGVGTVMDVTESKQNQERLQASLNETRRAQARLEEAQRLSHMGNWVWDISTNRMLLSDEHKRIFGLTADQLDTTYDFALNTLHPEDRERIKSVVEGAIRERANFDCEFRIVLQDGSTKTLHSRGGPAADEFSRPNEYVGTVIDITERKQREEETRKLVSLIENSTECIGYTRSITQIDYMNSAWRRLVGLDPDDDLSKYQISDFLPAEDYRFLVEEALPVLSRDGHWEGERSLQNVRTKALIPVQQTLFFITEPGTDRRIAMAVICRDITERKQIDSDLRTSLAEKEALLKEVHHRVKNNLQLISSLLNLQAARIADPAVAEGFEESRNRVRSMALVHENLYRAGNFARIPMGTHVPNLCAHLIRAYGLHSRHVELATDVDDIELDLDRATSVGLIVNELVSNAFKHAFPDGREGSVRVEMKRLRHATQCRLAVIDDGIGLPSDAESIDSLGLQLVRDLARQLHGTFAIERDEGTTFAVTFDVQHRVEASQ